MIAFSYVGGTSAAPDRAVPLSGLGLCPVPGYREGLIRRSTMATNVNIVSGTQPPAAGHNNPPSANLQAWLDQSRVHGETGGAGDTSLMAWFQDTVARAYRDEIGPEDAE